MNRLTRIGILAYPNCVASAVLGALDVFAIANWEWQNRQAESIDNALPMFQVQVLSLDGQPVQGFGHCPAIVPHDAVQQPPQAFDLIMVPPWLGDLEAILHAEHSAIAWIKDCHVQGINLSAVCTGTFFLAEAGLLAGRPATTHWMWAPHFRKRYPEVSLKPERILIDGGDVICAGGMTAYLDLSLYLVAKYGSADLATTCSKLLLVDTGRWSQAPYQLFNAPKNHLDEPILRTQDWLEEHHTEPVSIQELAQVANLEKRTFMRRFKRATGDSPLQYVQQLRISSAKHLLESTNQSFAEITWQLGYQDVSSFQRLFKQVTGLSPGDYRNKFSLLVHNP
jgi:transcriptional regulator GlxA family with amidase domain